MKERMKERKKTAKGLTITPFIPMNVFKYILRVCEHVKPTVQVTAQELGRGGSGREEGGRGRGEGR